jgi:hypothetical protein
MIIWGGRHTLPHIKQLCNEVVNLCSIDMRWITIWFSAPSWPWLYDSWIYNYLCNQCLSLLMLWARISIGARCTTLCDKVCQWLATGRWFSPGPPVSSTNKTDRHDITEILLKVAVNTIYFSCSQWILSYLDLHFKAVMIM